MAQDTLKKIAQYKSRLAELERELFVQLAKLPAQFGFDSADDFIAAFRQSVSGKQGRRVGKGVKAALAKKAPAGRKPRAKITDEIVEQVKKLVGEGKTGSEIAAATGISLPSVQNLKKKLGLVGKKR